MTDTLVNFDGGTIGANLSAGSNGIQAVPDALAPTFVTGFHGAAAVRAGGAANTADCRFRVDLGVSGNHYGSIYMKYNTPHSSSGNFVNFWSLATSSNVLMMTLRAGSNRELNMRIGASTTVRTGASGDIPNNSLFRFDWRVNGTTFEWKLFYDPEADDASTPNLSGSQTLDSGTPSRLVLGCQSSTALTKDWSYDTLRATNTGSWFEPFNPPPPDPGDETPFTVWNGSIEVPVASMGVWNGTTEEVLATWEVA